MRLTLLSTLIFLLSNYKFAYANPYSPFKDDLSVRMELSEEIANLVSLKKYEEIEKLYQKFLKEKPRVPSGAFRLQEIYAGVTNPCLNTLGACQRLAEDWRRNFPNSHIPDSILALQHQVKGIAARGTGLISGLSESSLKKFNEHLGEEWKYWKKAASKTKHNPYILAALYRVAFLLHKKKEMDSILEEIWNNSPEYFHFYDGTAIYLQPKWGGSVEQFIQFADKAAKHTKKFYGDGVYSRLAWTLYQSEGCKMFKLYPDISWERTKNGYLDLIEAYPDSAKNLAKYLKISRCADDKDSALEAIEMLGNYWHEDIAYVFKSRREIKQYYNWARRSNDTKSDPVSKLIEAAKTENLEQIRTLVRQQVDPNQQNLEGTNAFGVALHYGKKESLKVLNEIQLEVFRKGKKRFLYESHQMLPNAALNGSIDIIRLALPYIQDMGNLNDPHGTHGTMLVLASFGGYIEIVDLLLKQPNILVNRRSLANHISPLCIAARDNRIEIVEALLKHPNINLDLQCSEEALPALYLAVQKGHIDVVKKLLAHGAEHMKSYGSKANALEIAIKNEQQEMINLLKSQ